MRFHEISNNVVCATSKGTDQPAHISVPKILRKSQKVFLEFQHKHTCHHVFLRGQMSDGLVHLYHMLSSQGLPRKIRLKTIIWNGINLATMLFIINFCKGYLRFSVKWCSF